MCKIHENSSTFALINGATCKYMQLKVKIKSLACKPLISTDFDKDPLCFVHQVLTHDCVDTL